MEETRDKVTDVIKFVYDRTTTMPSTNRNKKAVAVIADRIACWYYAINLIRPVNKNVNTGAVMKVKQGTEPGVHKLLANYQAGFSNKFIGLRTVCRDQAMRFFRVDFMNASKQSTQA